MAQEYSFDVVSQFDRQELVNAVNQAQREIVTRYDFKDTGASIDLGEDEITLAGPSDFKMKAMLDVLQGKLVKRQLSLKILKPGPIEPAAKGTVRQKLELVQGIDDELARTLVKQIKRVIGPYEGSKSREVLMNLLEVDELVRDLDDANS